MRDSVTETFLWSSGGSTPVNGHRVWSVKSGESHPRGGRGHVTKQPRVRAVLCRKLPQGNLSTRTERCEFIAVEARCGRVTTLVYAGRMSGPDTA